MHTICPFEIQLSSFTSVTHILYTIIVGFVYFGNDGEGRSFSGRRCVREETDVYEAHPMVERLNQMIAEGFFVKKEHREMSLVMNDASERYALFRQEYPDIENQVAQYHVASYLGITPTQLSRIRAKRD